MEYTYLGRTGVQVSRLALGCMNFGGRTPRAEALTIINAALDRGINLIDTANVYGHDPANFDLGRGRSEEIVGQALRQCGKRDQVFLATKVHYPMGSGRNAGGNSRRHIIEQCEQSLRRLQTDHIDLYQLHAPDLHVPIDETLRALDDLIRRGLVRYIGCSSFPAWKIIEALWVAKELGLNRFVSEQPPYNLLDRRIERELVPMAQTYALALIPWSPLAGGFLSGKYKADQPIPIGSRFDIFWGGFRREHAQQRVYAVVGEVAELARAKGITPAQVALRWTLQQPGITAPIIGPRTLPQLEDGLGALDFTLTEGELAQLDAVAPPRLVTVPYYGDTDREGGGWAAPRFR